ncbi:recombinase family protein [bacterium D16-51]|nr:recombinase family protein [bacterium D16-59]RKI61332.1 recombinase family protein [bacterium D16-51]
MCNFYSYMRISTEEERGLQKFTRQENALQRYAKENHIEYLLTFQEDKSGKDFDSRKQWQKLESIIQPGDTIVFKDVCRFTRQAEQGYSKYMELLNKGVELIFLDNQTISTPYIKQLLDVAREQNLVAKTSLESTVKLLLIVELDRAEQERATTVQRIKDGIAASNKKSGRPAGKLDKVTDALKDDIRLFLADRTIKQIDLMKKHGISRNTLKKYISLEKDGRL